MSFKFFAQSYPHLNFLFKIKTKEYTNIKIVSPTHSLFYINVDYFRDELYKICPLQYATTKLTICQNCKTNYGCFFKCCSCTSKSNEDNRGDTEAVTNETHAKRVKHFEAIVLDFTRCNFIDESGAKCLKEIVDKYAKENVKLVLSNCNGKNFEIVLN